MAYHFDKLVVSSDIPSLKEHIVEKETGYMFKKNNSNDLSNVLTEIYHNHNFNNSENFINKYKSRYSFDNFLNDFKELFENE